jgi:hypothetical protein
MDKTLTGIYDETTENGMKTHSTSGKNLVDMFFSMGASRSKDPEYIEDLFRKAYQETREGALRSLFYNRDVREGQGERRTFRIMFRWLAENDPETARKNLDVIPEYGRWDDVLHSTKGTEVYEDALNLYEEALESGDSLAAKWAPSEGKSDHDMFTDLRDHMFGSGSVGNRSKRYRKLVSGLRDVVEQDMCEENWNSIDYESVPSQAIRKYRNAFVRNDEDRFEAYLDDVLDESTDTKMSAGAIFPHEIVKPILQSRSAFGSGSSVGHKELKQLEGQWKNLPVWMEDNVLSVVDVSGSMTGSYNSNSSTRPIDVAIGLGLYTAEHNTGPFQNRVVTFSQNPSFVEINGSNLRERVESLNNISWGMNTNISAVFESLLSFAKSRNVPESQMPETILVMSDMQFDSHNINGRSVSAMNMVRKKYEETGYEAPNIVFWNLDDSGNNPVRFSESGAALVSGFSPSIMKNILSGQNITPIQITLNTIMDDRYDMVCV